MVTKRTSGLPLICLVCGDVARGINFDLMTCMSCKAFFRRHAFKSEQCQMNNDCEINLRTRKICSACRLKKCLALGMNSNLIHQRSQQQMQHRSRLSLPKPSPLSLLRNDRSTLTTIEWNLLSNIIHAYDAMEIIPQVKHLLQHQSSLPPKIRAKPAITFEIIKVFYSSLQPFIDRSPDFHCLSTSTCRALIEHNSGMFGTINSIYIDREVNTFDYPAFLSGCQTIYGAENIYNFNQFASRLDRNGVLIRIMLFILGFSTNSSPVSYDQSENVTDYQFNITSVLKIQNILVTMLWKYLIYQYGDFAAVRWLNSFVKFVIDVTQALDERQNLKHSDMVETIVEETTRALTIAD